MTKHGYIKFAIPMGIIVGILAGIPIVNMVFGCLCLPLILPCVGTVSGYLLFDKNARMRTVDSALAGVATTLFAMITQFIVSSGALLLIMMFSPKWLEALNSSDTALLTVGMGVGSVFMYSGIMTLSYGLVFLMVGPLSSVAALHLFHSDRVIKEGSNPAT